MATDHAEIFDEVRSFGGQVEMTSPDAPSGTDRVAEVARRMTDVDIIVNVQGDEPEIAGSSIDLAIELLEENPDGRDEHAGHADPPPPAVGRPGVREGGVRRSGPGAVFQPQRDSAARGIGTTPCCDPIRRRSTSTSGCMPIAAISCCNWPRCRLRRLEQIEKLEQLRVLEAGHSILVGVVDEPTFGIDTPDDYRAFVEKQQYAV